MMDDRLQTKQALARLEAVRAELRDLLVEREEAIDAALAALVARQHVVLIGPPGTAKSMLAHELCRRIEGGQYFEWLLTKFTTPEELFGAVSLRALENDEVRRVTHHKLPEAHVAFLDEVFKSSSAILNAILTILNERLFHNGRTITPVPLLTLFGASNEIPEEDELAALYDRFLVRLLVSPIEDDGRFVRMLTGPPPPEPRARLSLADLDTLAAAATATELPRKALHDLVRLRARLRERSLYVSDRRWRQSIQFLRAMALVRGLTKVDDGVVRAVRHCLWSDPEELGAVSEAVEQVLRGYEEEAGRLLYQAREVHAHAAMPREDPQQEARAAIEAHVKLNRILNQVDQLAQRAREAGASEEPVLRIRQEIADLRSRVLGEAG